MFNPEWPWLIALFVAVWFALVARRAGRDWRLWAFGGFVLGLAVATIAAGLGHGVTVPYSNWNRAEFQGRALAGAVVFIGLVGCAMMLGLNRPHHRKP